jgi:hypothetical protein
VQLGRDPGALLGHRLLGPRLGVLLGRRVAQGARQAGAVAQQPAGEHGRGHDHQPAPDEVQTIVGGRVEDGHGRDERHQPADADRQPAALEIGADRVGHDEGRREGPDERCIRVVAQLLQAGERREHEEGGHERRATTRGHAQRHGESQAARGEDRARGRVEKGQLDLRLQQESSRQKQVGTAGRQGLHARPQRRQCPHARTVTPCSAAIVVRSGDRLLILKDDAGSSRWDAQIAPTGDDAALPSWERQRP